MNKLLKQLKRLKKGINEKGIDETLEKDVN